MDDTIVQYIESLLPERNSLFNEMEQLAKDERVPIMELTGIDAMLQIMRIQNPKKILEIGTAIGYSALRMADGLPETNIVTIEMDEDRVNYAKDFIARAGMDARITILKGNALDLSEEARQLGPFDAIFLDAAKGQYEKLFEIYSSMLNSNGCVYSDNVLFKGMVAGAKNGNKRLEKIAAKLRKYNEWLMAREDFQTTIFSVGDGLAVSRKKD